MTSLRLLASPCLASLPALAAVSGSQDCSLKVWDLESGGLHSSLYTYNPISRLVVAGARVVTATTGGKLEVFCLATSSCLLSQRVGEEGVTALASLQGEGGLLVASGTGEGVVRLHRLQETEGGCELACLYVTEEVRSGPGVRLHCRPVSCLQIAGGGRERNSVSW